MQGFRYRHARRGTRNVEHMSKYVLFTAFQGCRDVSPIRLSTYPEHLSTWEGPKKGDEPKSETRGLGWVSARGLSCIGAGLVFGANFLGEGQQV